MVSTTGSGVVGTAAIKINAVTDTGASIGKLQAVANESAPPIESYCGILTTKGISVRLTGTSMKAHLVYE